ncbi:predicted protein [Streptomyces sp. C]|nr:predicted protein [Streptomyces sp. C]
MNVRGARLTTVKDPGVRTPQGIAPRERESPPRPQPAQDGPESVTERKHVSGRPVPVPGPAAAGTVHRRYGPEP